jgi:hypothetical protein
MANLRASVKDDEIKLFDEFAATFWDPNGPAMLLHKMIPAIRIPLILDGLSESGAIKKENRDKSNVLEGIKILGRVGCDGLMRFWFDLKLRFDGSSQVNVFHVGRCWFMFFMPFYCWIS